MCQLLYLTLLYTVNGISCIVFLIDEDPPPVGDLDEELMTKILTLLG